MAECKFMRQNDDEKYCTMFLAKCDSKELESCCDDNCTVRDMAEEIERLKICLQGIKTIVCSNCEIIDTQGRKDILKLINKTEEV